MLAVGQATKMPMRIAVTKICNDNNKPDSDDSPFGEKWKVEIARRSIPDIAKVCDKWIRSEKPDSEVDSIENKKKKKDDK